METHHFLGPGLNTYQVVRFGLPSCKAVCVDLLNVKDWFASRLTCLPGELQAIRFSFRILRFLTYFVGVKTGWLKAVPDQNGLWFHGKQVHRSGFPSSPSSISWQSGLNQAAGAHFQCFCIGIEFHFEHFYCALKRSARKISVLRGCIFSSNLSCAL